MNTMPAPEMETFAGQDALARLAKAKAIGTPFQSAQWIGAWLNAQESAPDLRVIRVTIEGGEWWLPLERASRLGVMLLRKIGGQHASFFTPLAIGAPRALTKSDLPSLVRAGAADALVLTDCPVEWAERAPFTADFPPSPDIARGVSFGAGAISPYTGEAAKKLRAKLRKLEVLGPVEARFLAGSEAGEALACLLAWKAEQFRAMGVGNAFAGASMQKFLREGLEAGGNLRLFALMLTGRPVAALMLAQSGDHASGMANAYTPEPDIARCGPGDILLWRLSEALKLEGLGCFDLGVGDARYKRLHCPQAIPLHDVYAASSLRGAGYIAAYAAARAAKARLKADEGRLATLKALRAKLLGGGSSA